MSEKSEKTKKEKKEPKTEFSKVTFFRTSKKKSTVR